MKHAIGFLFALLFATNAMAGQLIVKENGYRVGFAYVLDVTNLDHCIRIITNLSNIHKYTSKELNWRSNKYFRKEFTCINVDGTISKHAYIYQIPYSLTGKMCLRWSEWNGLYRIDECIDEGFITRPIITNHSSSHSYIIDNQEE